MTQERIRNSGLENLTRSKSKLFKNLRAMEWLCTVNDLTKHTIEKFHLGLAEPIKLKGDRICLNSLSVPIIGYDGNPRRRRFYYNIPNVTTYPKNPTGWGCGSPLIYYSSNIADKKRIFVCGNIREVWRLDQEAQKNKDIADILFVASSQENSIVEEFVRAEFWSQFEEIYFGHPTDQAGNRIAENLRKLCFANVKRILLPGELNWIDFFKTGGTKDQLIYLLDDAKLMSFENPAVHALASKAILGEFAIDPVNCNGAYVNEHLYYPYRVEKREIERITHRDGSTTESIVTSYLTKVVRSDGAVLDIGYLPAPRGTPIGERVLALSDGTRIEQVPKPNLHATWHLDSITNFIESLKTSKKAGHRPLREILTDLELHYRRSVWLPFEEDYTLLALYTALSFVYNVFEAIPLLIVCGPKGTGKTDLGLAIEAVAFNAKIIGQSSAASAVRIIHESRGLIIWDDLEALSATRSNDVFSDVHQMLKLSYKKKTSKKAITARNGQTTIFDFYGPKVINNTQGADSILGSRMLAIQTRKLPIEMRGEWNLSGSEPEFTYALRNELHVWGMSAARAVDEHYRKLFPEQRGDRKDEILVPLRTVAELSGDAEVIARLEKFQQREDAGQTSEIEPTELLKKALESCIVEGYFNEIALPHIQLMIALLVNQNPGWSLTTRLPFWTQAQWIGSSMDNCHFRANNVPVRRARLYGKETRIYNFHKQFVQNTLDELKSDERFRSPGKSKNPFDFCININCPECPFVSICEETVLGLKAAKKKRLRYDI